MVLVAGPVLLSYLLEGVIAWADACLDLWRRWAGPSVGRQALLVVMAPVALAAILLDAIATWWRHGVAQWRAVA
jgi:hypothetical protein